MKTRKIKVKVPKNSQFTELRKKLPEEFCWIKDKKTLIREAMEMHHCVDSYSDLITADKCAIYSFYADKVRYTAEFRKDSELPQTVKVCGFC